MKRLFALAALILAAFTFSLVSCKTETDDDPPTQRATNTVTISPKTEDGTEITSVRATASADASIATVAAAEDGTVTITGVSEGTVTVTVIGKDSNDNALTVTYRVTVDKDGNITSVGEPVDFTNESEPVSTEEGTTVASATSANEGAVTASVDAEGKVTITSVSAGTTTVTLVVKNEDGNLVAATYTVTVADNGTISVGTPTESTIEQVLSDGTYNIGDTTYTLESGIVTVKAADDTTTKVGEVNADGTITISDGDGTTITIASGEAEGEITLTITETTDGTATTKTYAGSLASETFTNKDDSTDTISISKVNDDTGTTDPTTPSDETTANQTAANAVIAKINAIGTVAYTSDCKAKIDDARAAYNALSETQKALVTNYDTLTAAESTYSTLKASADEATANQAAADAVIAKISAIGTVAYTDDCKAKIDDARAAYDTLTDTQKALISDETLAVLTNAEATYESLITYTVTIADTIEHGTVRADKSPATKGETITLTATPADGYKLGSYTVKNGEESVIVTNNTFTMPASNVTVSATFTASSYEITYKLDGGTNASANPATYTIESDDITLSSASKDGYTFSGWQNADGETVTKIAKGTTGDITLTATWTTANGISVTIAPDSAISIEQTETDSTITFTASEGFTGYSWRIDGEPASSVTGAAVSEDGTTLTLTKASLTQGNVYQISLSATKGGIPYGTQISVKK